MRIEANKIAVRRFGLVLQRLDGNKRAIGEAMGDRDVELLLKTISGRSKLRVADMKKGRLYTVHCCPMAQTAHRCLLLSLLYSQCPKRPSVLPPPCPLMRYRDHQRA